MLNYIIISISSILAASGQILLKMGADKYQGNWLEWINWYSFLGCLCYGLGLLLWVYSLSKLPLSIAYLFTMLTFILVYILNWLIFGESLSSITLLGIMLVSIGMLVIYLGQTVFHK